MKTHWIVAAGLACAAAPGAAQAAQCSLSQFTIPGVTLSYDPFDAANATAPIQIIARTSGDCVGAHIQLALVPTPRSPQTGSKARLTQGTSSIDASVSIGGQTRPIVAEGAAFNNNPLSLPLGSAGDLGGSGSITIAIDAGQVSPPGSYGAFLTVLGRVTDARGKTIDTQSAPLFLSATVKPSVRVAVGAGDLDIDLGELKPGTIGGPINFDAYANVDYTLRLRSEGGFVMRPGGTGSAPGVPYTPMIDTQTPQRAGGTGSVVLRQLTFTAPGSGMRHHALKVRVDPFGNLAAGRYSDVMTVEIRARV